MTQFSLPQLAEHLALQRLFAFAAFQLCRAHPTDWLRALGNLHLRYLMVVNSRKFSLHSLCKTSLLKLQRLFQALKTQNCAHAKSIMIGGIVNMEHCRWPDSSPSQSHMLRCLFDVLWYKGKAVNLGI